MSVETLEQLVMALRSNPTLVEVNASITVPVSLVVPAGCRLVGKGPQSALIFPNTDGLRLRENTSVESLSVLATPAARAIALEPGVEDFGTLTLRDLSVTGQIGLIARIGAKRGRLVAERVHVKSADARHYTEQPQKYGVNVLQGAFTLYNFNADPATRWTAKLFGISVGMEGAPVFGSGIFLGGFGDDGGTLEVEELTTGSVYSTGGLTFGTADLITGGVFVLYGASVKVLRNMGPTVTYGVNDMALDNWGHVDDWVVDAPVTTYGPSGIGFVNFGTVGEFRANAPFRTYGGGARGFNQYDGTVDEISFESIETFGDGAIGVQISKPIGSFHVRGDVTTHGATGPSLVKGVVLTLPAMAISVKNGGEVQELRVHGNVATEGDGCDAVQVEGEVHGFHVDGSVSARGQGAQNVVVSAKGVLDEV